MDICLLVNGSSIMQWQANALEHLLTHTDVEVTTIVYNEYEDSQTNLELIKRGIELREWAIVSILRSTLPKTHDQEKPINLASIIDESTVTELHVKPNILEGWKQEIPAHIVEEISKRAEVAIRFGFGFLTGPILSEVQYGVLSYHHGDLREYRGQPMGFWEFIHDESTAGITVQQLDDNLDAGKIAAIKILNIDHKLTWGSIRRTLLEESEELLFTAIRSLQNNNLREPEELGQLYTHPTGLAVLKFAMKNTKGRIIDVLLK